MKTKKDSWNVYVSDKLCMCADFENGSVWFEDDYGNKFESQEEYKKYKRNKNIDFFLDNQ